jgi:hypothetical protein
MNFRMLLKSLERRSGRVRRGAFAAAAFAAALSALPACTHLLQTNAESLPDRMQFSEFSFARPQGDDWYYRDTSDPPTIAEFTKRGHRSETQILVIGFLPPSRVTSLDELIDFGENLPGADKVISPAPGHGATCVRYHGRSLLSVNYANTMQPYTDVMVTDEDSLECIDPSYPNYLVRFIFSQRSPNGGTEEGTREADAFLDSIKFDRRN